MANSTNSLSHTKWLCKYHIVIVPKYRRKIIYNQYRHFWAEGYYVSTVGLNESTIKKYIQDKEKADIALDKLSVKEYADPFS
ncbi:MAG: transposase [Clostridia bacterium]|nr:transposase [Clostridia bacterium]